MVFPTALKTRQETGSVKKEWSAFVVNTLSLAPCSTTPPLAHLGVQTYYVMCTLPGTRPSKNENVLVFACRPVAHYRRVGVSLAGEGDSVPLQDRARLNGQGHCRRICKGERERLT